jgi:hypothetical protein
MRTDRRAEATNPSKGINFPHTDINTLGDQLGLLDFWARAGWIVQVGFSGHDGSREIEHWAPATLAPIDNGTENHIPWIAMIAWGVLETEEPVLRHQLIDQEAKTTIRMKLFDNETLRHQFIDQEPTPTGLLQAFSSKAYHTSGS